MLGGVEEPKNRWVTWCVNEVPATPLLWMGEGVGGSAVAHGALEQLVEQLSCLLEVNSRVEGVEVVVLPRFSWVTGVP